MSTCTVEMINALWSFVGLGVAGTLVGRWVVPKLRSDSDDPAVFFSVLFGAPAAFLVVLWGSLYGQDAMRFYAADVSGYACEYSGGKIKVIKPEGEQ